MHQPNQSFPIIATESLPVLPAGHDLSPDNLSIMQSGLTGIAHENEADFWLAAHALSRQTVHLSSIYHANWTQAQTAPKRPFQLPYELQDIKESGERIIVKTLHNI